MSVTNLWEGKRLTTQSSCLIFLAIITIMVASRFISISAHATENEIKHAALTVTTTSVLSLDWNNNIEASGDIVAWQEAIIGAQLNGLRLTEVLVDVGDYVKKGQLIARFDNASLLNDKALLEANLNQASALVKQANIDYQRAFALSKTDGISKQNLLQAETQKQTTTAEESAVTAQLASNALQLSYVNVTSPDEGVISSRTATLGGIGTIGEELFRLIRGNKLEWYGQLTAQQASHLTLGQKITLDLTNNSEAIAYIRQISPIINPQTRMLTVYASLEPNNRARAGMFALGKIQLNKTPALVVPSISIVIRDGRSYVFELINETQQVIQRPIKVARRQGDYVEITGNIKAGASIIKQGAGFLNEGDIVKVVEEQEPITFSGAHLEQEAL
ncbi:efflux RND transporter periplasmic adaptor subunit [Marinomonas foliarum]|uniref:RND family efflux transporter MFP subunit n=1 Tax=Marinomonas foliarum TaxID=491950 RepID=A0A368ZW52_9GAMM|nr:efflux RND transporter periplasmic adaptor subunit [Marinomonas foliarum]RCX01173.1 RND family efflux transporter MFP subunit [Marinomonas foliarum]